jgi:P27 family predicted phage terminase small subunit
MRQISPPKGFSPDAKDIWLAAQRQLRLQGTWERTDAVLLEMYCQNAVAARQARADVERLRHGGDSMMLRAMLKQANDSEAAVMALAKALLLTPEARRRAGVKQPSANDADNELAALVG